MKTKGLTFTEAVEALKEKKCKGITYPAIIGNLVVGTAGVLAWTRGGNFLPYQDTVLRTDWELVDPVPETVTVNLWANVYQRLDGTHYIGLQHTSKELAENAGDKNCTRGVVKITHTYEVPSNA